MAYRIIDDFNLKFSEKEIQKIKDSYTSDPSGGLYVRIQATHAGLINRNNFFYLPDKMRDSVGTFLTPFQKPILVNHNEEGEPIGRVIAAKYVDSSALLKDSKVQDSLISDNKFNSFLSGQMTLNDQVTYITDTLYDKLLNDPNFAGLGYAEIIARISDKTAIEKFLDGRYLTGSVSASTDKAICSVCKEDWSNSGHCEHLPGKVYDKKKMFLIAGQFGYEHWAVVNTPADGHSKATEVSDLPLTDSKNENGCTLSDISVELLSDYSEEEKTDMKVQDEKKVTDETTETPVTDVVSTEEDVQDEAFDDFITRILDGNKVTDEDLDKLYLLMTDEMKEAGLDEQIITDAVLSTEKRKKLAKSTFCGPGKSFPVPDCAHVTAARRLIGRYKGTGNKETILACVTRKAKSMGCDKGMKDSVETPEVKDDFTHINILQQLLEVVRSQNWAVEEKKPLTEEQLGMVQELISAMAAMVTQDTFVDVLLSEKAGLADKLSDKADDKLLDEIVSLETKLGDLHDELELVKDELKTTASEAEVLRDGAILAKTNYRKVRTDYLTLLKSLKDKVVVKEEELVNLEDSALDTELTNLMTDFDLSKIVEKLDDGMARKPEGTVESPTQIVDNSKENAKITVEAVEKELQHIQDTFFEMSLKNSIAAKRYLDTQMLRMKKEGKLPE